MPRDCTVSGRVYAFRLPPEEESSFEQAVEDSGLSISEFTRKVVLEALKDV